MKFISTRGKDSASSIDDVLKKGIADDGGLFLPESLPVFKEKDFNDSKSIIDTAKILLYPFFEHSVLKQDLDYIIKECLSFDIPSVRAEKNNLWYLELFHGPTAAFKDVGARFLASCLSKLNKDKNDPLIILVATSGDTGGAVAAAFHGLPNVKVIIFFPEGKVSKRQEKQLTSWGDNILALSVKASFDSCQDLVKKVFADHDLMKRYRFSSANSINMGRLLPQAIYYAHTGISHYKKTNRKPNFIIPTGNLGNGLACILSKQMGFPIGRVILALNENKMIKDFIDGDEWEKRKTIQTLANAMDVGNASNMERLTSLFSHQDIQRKISATSISDDEIKNEIIRSFHEQSIILCPHTSTASCTYQNLNTNIKTEDWVVVATAHPAKFETIVEPLIETNVKIPDELKSILNKPNHSYQIEPSLDQFRELIDIYL